MIKRALHRTKINMYFWVTDVSWSVMSRISQIYVSWLNKRISKIDTMFMEGSDVIDQ